MTAAEDEHADAGEGVGADEGAGEGGGAGGGSGGRSGGGAGRGREAPGVVSVWTGIVRDEDELFDHVEMSYPDGDAGPVSGFLAESGIGWYDEDFAEGGVSADPGQALDGHSHGAAFAARARRDLAGRPGVNALYLVYDVDASASRGRPGLLAFLGAYRYRDRDGGAHP